MFWRNIKAGWCQCFAARGASTTAFSDLGQFTINAHSWVPKTGRRLCGVVFPRNSLATWRKGWQEKNLHSPHSSTIFHNYHYRKGKRKSNSCVTDISKDADSKWLRLFRSFQPRSEHKELTTQTSLYSSEGWGDHSSHDPEHIFL